MIIKKKDIKQICGMLSALSGPISVNDLEGNILHTEGDAASLSSFARQPVVVDGEPVGSVVCDPGKTSAVTGLLGLHLKNLEEKKKITEHTLQKYRELSFLGEIHNILSSSLNINEILCAATRRVHEMIQIESCSVMVADHKTGNFVLRAISGRVVNEQLELMVHEGIGGRALDTGVPVIANNPSEHPYFVQKGNIPISSLLCLPLKLKDVPIGILNLRNKTTGIFTSEDEALLTSMCAAIAEAIENARLIEEKIKDEKFTAIGQMAAGIIHDIKNPMTTIKGFAGLLGDMDFTQEERKEYSKIIVGEVDRLVSMVEDLLAFTRGFKSKMALEMVSVEKYLSEVLPLIEKDMTARSITVTLIPGYRERMLIDPERFKRVIFNICGNAREVMHDGGRFLLLTRQAGINLEIVFADSGSGIPEDIVDTIFEPFVTKGKKSGTGLGLAITKKIIEEHGGTIRALNGNYSGVEGFEGANFVVLLPVPADDHTQKEER